MAEQLPFDLPHQAADAIGDLVVSSSNREAVSFIKAWPNWPSHAALIAGPPGAGKTHLAKIWAKEAAADIADTRCAWPNPQSATTLLIENVSLETMDQHALFHLYNETRSNGLHLLMTSRSWPGDWGVDLPDLASRLKTIHVVELPEPDDGLLIGVMTKLFSDRQVQIEPHILTYLVARMERSLICAGELVDCLDALSLAKKRPITRALAAEALVRLGLPT